VPARHRTLGRRGRRHGCAVSTQLRFRAAGEIVREYLHKAGLDTVECVRRNGGRVGFGRVDSGRHVGLHESDMQRCDADTVRLEFFTDDVSLCPQRRFRTRVGPEGDGVQPGQHRCHVEDRTGRIGDQVWREGPGDKQRSEEIRLHLVPNRLQRRLEHPTGGVDPCVVDQKCCIRGSFGRSGDTVHVSDVNTERNDTIDSDRPRVTCCCIDFRRAPREQLFGEVLTETAVSAGDQRD
jgi:hypothetical protein